jgi:ribulose 1,5-bisphosphate carboxylase large subunit-like protein
MDLFKSTNDINLDKYFIATYKAKSATTLSQLAWDIAVGQSVGNPSIRNKWEDDELYENHSCLILNNKDILENTNEGFVDIAFPVVNIDWENDGVNHLICQLMGGHTDINIIERCRLVGLQLPEHVKNKFKGPKFGITGMRKLTGSYNKPLLGGILKPKVIHKASVLEDMVRELIDGGVDFIKEDEIMSSVPHLPLERRVDIVANLLSKVNHKLVFCHTINADPYDILRRCVKVMELGGNGVHVNVLGGLGVYNSIRRLDLPIFIHFQSSGQKLFTDIRNPYSISWPVVCQLATMMGVDTIQTGMIGGYSNDDPAEIFQCINILRAGNTVPALSCGFHPGMVDWVTNEVGIDYLANSGGAIHGHPGGTLAGTRAMRQAVDGTHGPEYKQAVDLWGIRK